ncbi:hypothetical protein BFP76_08405 [Amylibacter kogurei]|uniref:Core-binding (CB) domain-containing protein n=2 Tax=Paramylibacter kogurei TaxID=1889778 RepID=A0A2G5K0U1_9RHOB|nr:hypothetical protein BFP76_08405 [Amylibacter kogurei]
MKYVQIDANRRFRYRRRIPNELKKFFGKSEFVKVLGITEKEALQVYGNVHGECEHLLAIGKGGVTNSSDITTNERLQVLLKQWNADPFSSGRIDEEQSWREEAAYNILNSYHEDKDTGRLIGVSLEDSTMVSALLNGISKEKPEPTLTDAFKFYLKEHSVEDAYKQKKQHQRFRRVELWLLKILQEDKRLSLIGRTDARKWRDARKESGVSVSSIKRELNDIKAVFNCARSELS